MFRNSTPCQPSRKSNASFRALLMVAASVAGLLSLTAMPANAACDEWNGGSGNWFGGNGWSAGDPNNSGTDVCITNGPGGTVDLNGTASVGDLMIGSLYTLDILGTLNVYGASVSNSGVIELPNTTFTILGNVALSGGGTVEMSSDAFFNQNGGSFTLSNVDNTIEGTGQLGQNGLALNNESGGIVNANGGGTLNLNGGGLVTNAGLLEATNSGILQISNTVNNAGGNITANGGTVDISATINGGTLNTAGTGVIQNDGTTTLNGVTVSTGSTYTAAGQNNLLGTITNIGLITSPNGNLTILGNVTLTGSGTVQMQSNTYFNENGGSFTLDNVNNTIEGTGQLGENGMALHNEAGGTVDANVNAGTLTLNGGGLVTNAGLLEATDDGILQISNTVDNSSNITANGGTVYLNATINGGTLNTAGGGVIENDGTTTLNGVTLSSGSTYTAAGQNYLEGTITNYGLITSPNGNLTATGGDVTLSGGGTVQMLQNTYINQNGGNFTLFNTDNTIEGTGELGENGLALENEAGGTVDANVNGGTLTLNGGGLVTNAGLLEATNGGILQISNTVDNSGANITANGGTVDINAIINGGTLNATGANVMQNDGTTTLNGVTLSSGSTYLAAGQNYLEGTVTNYGLITSPNGNLTATGGDVTLSGGGTVQMLQNTYINQNGGNFTLFNTDNTIEGTGELGENGLALENEAGGTVDANVNGGTLTLNGGGTVTNAGLLEATSGGVLLIQNTVNNSSNITADGGTVNINATINGGTLNSINGGTLEGSGDILNGITLSGGSTYHDTGTTDLEGTITNVGVFTLPNTNLTVVGGSVTLTGGGTVEMASNAFFNQNGGSFTLLNVNNTIEGTGQLGQNGLALNNEAAGIVDANVGGGTLSLNGGGLVTNAGLLEATSGGILQIQNTVNNSSNITADGGTVNISSTINGGTLNSTSSGILEGSGDTLNGITLSSGSIYTDAGSTDLVGTITNNGTIVVPNNNLTVVGGSVTLTGGGTVEMSSNAFFNQNGGNFTLLNVNNTIEGTGQLGQNGLSLDNESAGTVLANVSGGTLNLNGGGSVTNDGLFEVTTGATMDVNAGTFTNFGSATLTDGTYEIFGTAANAGTLQINDLGNTGGEIVNNDATIILNGMNSNLVDAGGKDALSNFDNNESGGSFTITNGRNFTGPGAFANAGDVTVGTNSTFSAGSGVGLAAYTQSAGDTIVDGTLEATKVAVNGGELQGIGALGSNSVETDLFNYGGTVRPGDPGSTGTLTVNGNFTQGAAGTLEIDIAGTSRYSQLDVNGQTLLNRSTLAVVLLGGFGFATGESFDILNTDPFSDDFGGFSLNGVACTSGGTDIWDCSNLANGLYLTEEFMDNGDQLWLQVDGQSQHGVPEPDSLALLGSALGALAAAALLRRRKGAMPA